MAEYLDLLKSRKPGLIYPREYYSTLRLSIVYSILIIPVGIIGTIIFSLYYPLNIVISFCVVFYFIGETIIVCFNYNALQNDLFFYETHFLFRYEAWSSKKKYNYSSIIKIIQPTKTSFYGKKVYIFIINVEKRNYMRTIIKEDELLLNHLKKIFGKKFNKLFEETDLDGLQAVGYYSNQYSVKW